MIAPCKMLHVGWLMSVTLHLAVPSALLLVLAIEPWWSLRYRTLICSCRAWASCKLVATKNTARTGWNQRRNIVPVQCIVALRYSGAFSHRETIIIAASISKDGNTRTSFYLVDENVARAIYVASTTIMWCY